MGEPQNSHLYLFVFKKDALWELFTNLWSIYGQLDQQLCFKNGFLIRFKFRQVSFKWIYRKLPDIWQDYGIYILMYFDPRNTMDKLFWCSDLFLTLQSPKTRYINISIFSMGLERIKYWSVFRKKPFIGFLGKKYIEIHISYMILACIYAKNALTWLQDNLSLLVTHQEPILCGQKITENYQTPLKFCICPC